MSSIEAWLAERSPAPPPSLASALRIGSAKGPADRALTEAACARLDEARARPGRVRESAFRLLEADALLTYACEAALDAEEPESALHRILVAAGR